MTRLATPRTVAVSLGLAQAALALVAIGTVQLGDGSVVAASLLWFGVIALAIATLESSSWAPDAVPEAEVPDGAVPAPRRFVWRAPDVSVVEAGVIALIAIVFGLSPLLEGFYDIGTWSPIALALLAVLLGLVIGRPAVLRGEAAIAVGGLGVLWLVSLISISWSESADHALAEANRWLLYLVLFAVASLLLRTDRLARVLLAAMAGAVLTVATYVLVLMLAGDASLFAVRHLHGPLGYVNAQAGYLLLAVWPLVAVAERARDARIGGAAIAGAVVVGGLAVLGQTRALIPVMVVVIAVLLLAIPGRARRVMVLGTIAGGVLLALPSLLDVYGDGSGVLRGATLRGAAVWLLAAAAAAGLTWWRFSDAAERGQLPRASAAVRRMVVAGIAAAAVLGGLATVGNPLPELESQVEEFTSLQPAEGGSRFVSASGNRYDYWRIAADAFADHPLQGLGAGNYENVYFLERRTTEEIRQPHSLVMQLAAELGILGLAALLIFVTAVALGLRRHARAARTDPLAGAVAVAAGGVFLTWLLHAGIDWVHLIPGPTGIALCAGAALVGPWAVSRRARFARRERLAAAAAGVVVVAIGATTVGGSWLAERYRDQAEAALAANPARALENAEDALAINDESLPSYYLKAAAQARFGDYEAARATLIEATRREPSDFVPWVLLGDLAVRRGDLATAAADYSRASELNPRDPALRRLAQDPSAATRDRVDPP